MEIIYSVYSVLIGPHKLITYKSWHLIHCNIPHTLYNKISGTHKNKYATHGEYSPSRGCITPAWTNTWWRHQIETFFALLALCAGISPVTDEFPSQRPVMRSFDVSFDLRLNKRLSNQSRRRWFETPSRSLWRHRNDMTTNRLSIFSEKYGNICTVANVYGT